MVKAPSVKKMGQNYLNIKKQILKNYKFISNIKTTLSIMLFILSISLYGYFVNVSSTKGYFLRQEKQKLSEIKFQNEIIKIDVRKIEGDVFNKTLPVNLDSSLSLTGKVIILSNMLEVAKR